MKTALLILSLFALPLFAQEKPFSELLEEYLEDCRRDSVQIPVLVTPINQFSKASAETVWSAQRTQFILKGVTRPVWESDQPPVYRLYWRPREATLWGFRDWLKKRKATASLQ